MKIPKHIKEKMHKIAQLNQQSASLSNEVDDWFIRHGFEMYELRCGDGTSLEELDYGNDITDILCERIECGEFGPHRTKVDQE